jgi:hypothetical protein
MSTHNSMQIIRILLQPLFKSYTLVLFYCSLSCVLYACEDEENTSNQVNPSDMVAGYDTGGTHTDSMSGHDGNTQVGMQSGGTTGSNAGVQAGSEAGSMDIDMTLAGSDAGHVDVECDLPSSTQSQALINQMTATQIHPDAIWDGEAFWVIWNVANDEGKFEVWSARFDCALQPIVTPFVVDQTMGMNDIDPSIAVSGNVIAMTWSRDDGFSTESSYNLSTLIRFYDKTTGQALSETQRVNALVRREENTEPTLLSAAEGNMWMVDLIAQSQSEGFIISGAWGDPEQSTFRVYIQMIDTQGNVQGEGILVDPRGSNQIEPKVMLDRNGFIHSLWKGQDAQGTDSFHYAAWQLPTNNEQATYSTWSQQAYESLQEYAWTSADIGHLEDIPTGETAGTASFQKAWVIGSQAGGVITLIDPMRQAQEIGPNLSINLAPRITTGLVTTYQKVQGTQFKLWHRLMNEQGELSPIKFFEQTAPIAPYPLSIVPLNHSYLILWAQGLNPNFEIHATFLSKASQ